MSDFVGVLQYIDRSHVQVRIEPDAYALLNDALYGAALRMEIAKHRAGYYVERQHPEWVDLGGEG